MDRTTRRKRCVRAVVLQLFFATVAYVLFIEVRVGTLFHDPAVIFLEEAHAKQSGLLSQLRLRLAAALGARAGETLPLVGNRTAPVASVERARELCM